MPLEDMEFLQFHPTGLVPSGILMTEACRGEGGYLRNNEGDRFLSRYAPEKMELAPRDLVSRSMVQEIAKGKGFEGTRGLDYLHLDLTHLGEDKIKDRLPLIREIALKFVGVDPIKDPIPVRPVAHYSMGGISTDIHGATSMEGIWAAGEVACVSLHGANRLGSNSTAECLLWGRITGQEATKRCQSMDVFPEIDESRIKEEEDRLSKDYLQKDGSENHYQIREDLTTLMDLNMGVYRTGDSIRAAKEGLKELRTRYKNIFIKDRGRIYNTDLMMALELDFMLTNAEVSVAGALVRTESRGGHARTDYPKRDDENFLKHTMATKVGDDIRLDYSPVTITHWKPVERKY